MKRRKIEKEIQSVSIDNVSESFPAQYEATILYKDGLQVMITTDARKLAELYIDYLLESDKKTILEDIQNLERVYPRITSLDLVKAFAAAPFKVISLDLSGKELKYLNGSELATVFAAIPPTVVSLNLSDNGLGEKSADELEVIFAAIPKNIELLNLSNNNFQDDKLVKYAKGFSKIPTKVKIEYGDKTLQEKYDIKCLLDSYLEKRKAEVNSLGETKNYLHSSFFSIFQKSFIQKERAVEALKSALTGEGNVELTAEHLSTLRDGSLGKKLREFIKSGMGDRLVGEKVTTVRQFVEALKKKNSSQIKLK